MDILEGNISLNWIDFLLAGIFIFSLVVGTFKGLIKEIFSVVEWVGSIFLAYFFRLNLSSVLPLNNLNEFTKEILSSIIIFICAFIIFRLIGNIISIPLYFYKGLTFTSIQYIIFTVIAISGYYTWKKILDNSNQTA